MATRYDYRCACGVFEATAGREDRTIECPRGHLAVRLPFSGVPYLNGATVATSIPDPAYRFEAEKKQFNQTWGDATRSMELMRKNVHTTDSGLKSLDTKGMAAG